MAETQQAPVAMGHAILPPPSFLGRSYSEAPPLPPPNQLSPNYIHPVPRNNQQATSNQYAPYSSTPRHQQRDYSTSNSRAASYQAPIYAAGGTSSRAGDRRQFKTSSPPRTDSQLGAYENPSLIYSSAHGPSFRQDRIPHASTPSSFATSPSATSSSGRSHQTESAGQYEIVVRQQPLAARACGFGERDRRVIDPPPIVQLKLRDNATGEADPTDLRYPFNVVHCTLWSADGKDDETGIPGQDGRTTRRLMGTLVASPFYGVDEYDREGCFFCFPDLSCRTHGQYKLRFVLMRLEPNSLEPGQFMPTITETESRTFTVFTAKDFPGMRASTALTKALKQQGCAISVKKGNERSSHNGKEDDSNEEEKEETRSNGSKSKKRRN